MSIHKQLNNVYGVRAVDRSSVKCWPSWITSSKNSHTQLRDACHPGQPTAAITQISLQLAEELVWNNWRITNINHASQHSISKGTAKTLMIPQDIQKWVLDGLHEA
jgi:hypothetical protein